MVKLLNAYKQVGDSFQKPHKARHFENAALKRRGQVFQLPQESKLDFAVLPKERYQIYQRPKHNLVLKPEQTMQLPEKEVQEHFSFKQLQDAIQMYRQTSGTIFSLSAEIDKLAKGISTGQIVEGDEELSQTSLVKYKRKREELIKNREKELWGEFKIEHMLYIDDINISKQIDSNTVGQIMNFTI